MDSSSTELADAASLTDAELFGALWRDGDLKWLLLPHQKEVYEQYRAWEKLDPELETRGVYRRACVWDISRRWGKTRTRFLIRVEDCLRRPGGVYRFVTRWQKDIEEIIHDAAKWLFETCPDDLRPKYHAKKGPQSAGFYFPRGSVLKLAGLDKEPNALRGRASDGDDVDEAVYVAKLAQVVKNVLYPQYQGRPHARLCLLSSAPEGPDTEYDEKFVEDAKLRDAYARATIDDNTSLSDAARQEFIDAAGGREDPDCQREYFCVRTRNYATAIIPEFSETEHVKRIIPPKHFCGYVAMDPGMSDLLGLVFAYVHPELRKLIVVGSWAEYNAGTRVVADAVRDMESALWKVRRTPIYNDDRKLLRVEESRSDEAPTWWDGKALQSQPFRSTSDTDKRIIGDLWLEHGLRFAPVEKNAAKLDADDNASLLSLRNGIRDGRVLFDPGCGPVLDHVIHGKWNERRTEWQRSKKYGHYDCVAALKYLWRRIDWNANPIPPEYAMKPRSEVHVPPQIAARARRAERGLGELVFGRDLGKLNVNGAHR